MNEAKIDFRAEEYVAFDNEISSFHPPINSEMVDQKDVSIQEYFNEYVNKKQRIKLDSKGDEEPDDSEDEQESFQMTPRKVLAMIDPENKSLQNSNQAKKQKDMRDYFTDGTLSSCTEISLTNLKDIELCFQNKVIFSSFCILCFYVL